MMKKKERKNIYWDLKAAGRELGMAFKVLLFKFYCLQPHKSFTEKRERAFFSPI